MLFVVLFICWIRGGLYAIYRKGKKGQGKSVGDVTFKYSVAESVYTYWEMNKDIPNKASKLRDNGFACLEELIWRRSSVVVYCASLAFSCRKYLKEARPRGDFS